MYDDDSNRRCQWYYRCRSSLELIVVQVWVSYPTLGSCSLFGNISHCVHGASGSVLLYICHPIPESLANFRVTSTVTLVLVSSGGFPQHFNTPPFYSVLESVHGLFLHSVEDLITPISLPDGSKHVRCWMFPTGTNIHIGLAWKLFPDLTLDKFISSGKDVNKTAYAGFL